jgi:hypothetical protein
MNPELVCVVRDDDRSIDKTDADPELAHEEREDSAGSRQGDVLLPFAA